MNIKDRIKELRKNQLLLTQGDFSQKINISRSNLANIESGLVNVTDRVISDICTAFFVNETWLRTGQGDIFQELDRDESIAVWASKITCRDYGNDFVKQFVEMLTKLDEDDWKTIEKITKMLSKNDTKKD